MAVVELTRPSRHVALVRVNRPDARNALNKEVRTLINRHFSELSEDTETHAIVLAGSDKYFIAGGDIREIQRQFIGISDLDPARERLEQLAKRHQPLLLDRRVAVHDENPGRLRNQLQHLEVSAVTSAILLQAGIIGLLLVERRRRHVAQAEANSRRQEVVRLNRVTTASVVSSSIAHELNQPLGAILSNTEAAQVLLKADPPDVAQLGEILSDIVRDEQRACDIIGGLRNLQNNRTESDLRTFDLNDSVRDIVKIVSPEIARRGVNLRTILTPEPLRVRCDPIHLQQVLMNLVMNGVDAMDDVVPRNLSIRTALADADGIEVKISDSGTGIPDNKLASIFIAFVTTKPQGTGLGLPIARTILESYGGELWAENRARGAVFSFKLPLAKA